MFECHVCGNRTARDGSIIKVFSIESRGVSANKIMEETGRLFLAALLISGCTSLRPGSEVGTDAGRPVAADIASISETDKAILRIVLADWYADLESQGETWLSRVDGTLVVFTPTVTFTHRRQIEVDAMPQVVPDDVIVSFIDRNSQTYDISSVEPIGQGIEIATRHERYWVDFEERFPDAKGWVSIFVPGYSERSDQAMIRFWGGPRSHGTGCTYFLEKIQNEWTIKWKETVHYL